jgi:hypothetical protein
MDTLGTLAPHPPKIVDGSPAIGKAEQPAADRQLRHESRWLDAAWELRVSWARLPPAHTVSPARTPGRSLLAITYGRRIQCPRMRRNVALGRGQLEGAGHAVSPEPRSADERPGGAARWSQAERGDDARRIVASEGTTLDGYFAGSQGEIDWQALDKSSVVRAGRLRRRDELAQPLRGSCGRNTTPTLGASPVSSRRLLSPEVI